MASNYTTVDLSKLAAPPVVEVLDFETIFSAILADLIARDATFTALVESDPAFKLLEVVAYRELNLRQRVNDAARAVMLPFAVGADLDQIGANFNLVRLQINAGNTDAVPPVPPIYETDTDFRDRIQLALEGITTAGSTGSYVFHARSADPDVKDVGVLSPAEGVVRVSVLSRSGTGAASPSLVAAVESALNADEVRPLTDQVLVQSAEIVNFTIEAKIFVRGGPDSSVIKEAATAAIETYIDERRKIGALVSVSGIYSVLQRPGVEYVELIAPLADIVTGDEQAPFCTGFVIDAEVYQ